MDTAVAALALAYFWNGNAQKGGSVPPTVPSTVPSTGAGAGPAAPTPETQGWTKCAAEPSNISVKTGWYRSYSVDKIRDRVKFFRTDCLRCNPQDDNTGDSLYDQNTTDDDFPEDEKRLSARGFYYDRHASGKPITWCCCCTSGYSYRFYVTTPKCECKHAVFLGEESPKYDLYSSDTLVPRLDAFRYKLKYVSDIGQDFFNDAEDDTALGKFCKSKKMNSLLSLFKNIDPNFNPTKVDAYTDTAKIKQKYYFDVSDGKNNHKHYYLMIRTD